MLKSDKDLLLLFLLVGSPYPGGGGPENLGGGEFLPFSYSLFEDPDQGVVSRGVGVLR